MPERIIAGALGLSGFAPAGDPAWNVWLDANLRKLSVLAQGVVLSRVTSLPGAPLDGQVYIVPTADANGNKVAVRDAGAWLYFDPFEGLTVWVSDVNQVWVYDGAAWVQLVTGGGGSSLTVQDEGVTLTTGATKLNFVGASVTASEPATDEITIDVTGGATAQSSFFNPGGHGFRTPFMSVVAAGGSAGDPNQLLTDEPVNNFSWTSGATQKTLTIDFGAGNTPTIEGVMIRQSSATAQGTWQVEYSSDNATWTAAGPTFVISTINTVHTYSAPGNAFRYWRIRLTTGSTSSAPFWTLFMLKIKNFNI